jgi:hypothetical protein
MGGRVCRMQTKVGACFLILFIFLAWRGCNNRAGMACPLLVPSSCSTTNSMVATATHGKHAPHLNSQGGGTTLPFLTVLRKRDRDCRFTIAAKTAAHSALSQGQLNLNVKIGSQVSHILLIFTIPDFFN